MQKWFGLVLVGLSACATQSVKPSPSPPPVPAASAPALVQAFEDPLDPVPPEEPAGPVVPATIAAEETAAPGRLAPELIQKVVRVNFGALRKCYERVLERDPNVKGKTSTRFVIGRDGTVSNARVTLSGNLPPEMGTCMEAVFQRLTFDAPSQGIVTVVYPIVFSPGE